MSRLLLLLGLTMMITMTSDAADNARTIVCFGDSTTAPRGKLTVYADILEEELGGSVINAGVGGNTTAAGRARFARDVLAHQPDLCVIQFGINDAAVDVWRDPPATEPRVSLADYEANLHWFVSQLREQGCQVVLMTPNPLSWTPKLKGLYGKPPYDPEAEDGLSQILARYAAQVRALAKLLDVPLADVYAAYEAYGETDDQTVDDLLADGMHPNAAGQRLTAETLLSVLRDLPAQ